MEVCLNSQWGTICDDYWNDNAATVVCRMLGYSPYGKTRPTKTNYYMHVLAFLQQD